MSRKKNFSKKKRKPRNKKKNCTNNESFKRFREWFLPAGIFSHIPLHGNIKWTPIYLVWLTICWSWSDSRNLTDAYTQALENCHLMFGSNHLNTYQGFMNALVNWSSKLLPVVRFALRQAMQRIGGKFWRKDGWVPIAFDGSRSSAPRTLSNEAALCAENYGRVRLPNIARRRAKG